MNVIQRPRPREFCGTMQDYIIDTDVTITFAVEYGKRKILDEEYVPDANNQVRVRKLGRFCALAMWGVWMANDPTPQSDAAGTFIFYINGVKDSESLVMYSRLETRKSADTPGILSEVCQKVARRGTHEFVSGFLIPDAAGAKYTITAELSDGQQKTVSVAPKVTDTMVPITLDVSVDTLERTHKWADVARYTVTMAGGSIEFLVDASVYAQVWQFRFKNVYDMPEVLTCTGLLKLTGNNQSDTASMFGIERKFGIKVTDEYTIKSGPIYLQSDYKLWHNLLNAQQVSLWVQDRWVDIVITKQKFERAYNRSHFTGAEFSFRMADPDQNNLLEI